MTVFFVVALVLMLFWSGTITQAHAQTTNPEHLSAPAAEQNKLAELTQPFPKPNLRAEDVNDEIAELHAREDLLLESYTRVDGKPGAVGFHRARDGLDGPAGVAHCAGGCERAAHDWRLKIAVAVPLTSGFARTEGEQARARRSTDSAGLFLGLFRRSGGSGYSCSANFYRPSHSRTGWRAAYVPEVSDSNANPSALLCGK